MKNKKCIIMKIQYKRYFYKLRSKLKKKIRNGCKISKKILKKYHLINKISLYRKMGASHKRQLFTINVLKVFNLSTDPDTVLSFLKKLKNDLNNDTAYDLYIDHSNTEEINLDASYLFDNIIKEYSKYWEKLHIKIKISGKVSKKKEVNNFLLSFGLLYELNITKHKLFPELADSDYTNKYITYKKIGTSKETYSAGNASTELVNYFNNCFIANNLQIKDDETKCNLADCFGEIIKNAEEHSGIKPTEWIVLGCYSKSTHSCSFSIINYGNSFYQSLAENSSTARHVLDEVTKVIYEHSNFFEKLFLNKPLYEQAIWSYMAIQDGISSKRSESGKASTRGQGIIDVVEFIDKIRNKKSKDTHLSIISGNTFINLDYEYPLVYNKKGKNQETRRFVYLNKKGGFSNPPDLDKLKIMKSNFPGVIFSGFFIIDQDYLLKQMRSA